MKTFSALIVMLACFSVALNEARAGIITAVGGLSRTTIGGTSSGDFSSHGPGWMFGGLLSLAPYIGGGWEAGLFFGRRQITQTSARGSSAPTTLDIGVTYLELPIEHLWRLSRIFFVGAGAYYLQNLGGTYKAYVATDPGAVVTNSFQLPSSDLGLLGNLGAEAPIGKQTGLRFELRYNFGLLSTQRSREALAIAGLSYRF